MTLPVESASIGDQYARRAVDIIAQRFPIHAADLASDVLLLATTGTQRKVAFGTATVTFTAATVSAATAVNHGLGVTPVAVIASGVNAAVFYDTRTYTSTQFSAAGYAPFGATSGTFTFAWVAIG